MKKMSAIFAAVLFAASPAAFAEELAKDEMGFYVAPEVGYVVIGGDIEDLCDTVDNISGFSCEDSRFGFGIRGGYQVNEFVAFEGGVLFANDFGINGPGLDVDADFRTFAFGGRLNIPVNDNFSLSVKGGMHFWEQTIKSNSTISGISSREIEEDDADLYFGAGAEFFATDNASIRGDWTRYTAESDADAFGAAIVWRF